MTWGRKTGGKNFKPGKSGNPKGRPQLPKELVEAKKLNKAKLMEVLNELIGKSRAELKAMNDNPETDAFKLMVIGIISKAVTQGDPTRLRFLLDIIVGPITQKVQIEQTFHSMLVEYINEDSNENDN